MFNPENNDKNNKEGEIAIKDLQEILDNLKEVNKSVEGMSEESLKEKKPEIKEGIDKIEEILKQLNNVFEDDDSENEQEGIAMKRDEEAEVISDNDIYSSTLSNLSEMAGINLLTSSMEDIEEFVKNDKEGLMEGMIGMIKDHREKLGINN